MKLLSMKFFLIVGLWAACGFVNFGVYHPEHCPQCSPTDREPEFEPAEPMTKQEGLF